MKCRCSERPLGILTGRVERVGEIPYQVLVFGCTNKRCGEYKKPVFEKRINLLDNADTKIKKL